MKASSYLKKELEGFLLNRLFAAIGREALWLLDMGGLDLSYTMAMEKFRATGNPADRPSPSLAEHNVNGEFGRKTGKGWYRYEE